MVEIRQINPTRSNLKKFVEFQIKLYEGNPYFIPPLVSDEIATLDSKVNPAFDHCESAYFMAYRDGKAVGRIAAMINKQVNEKENSRQARFGFVDFIDDAEVSKALFDTAEQWAKEKGMDNIVGPLGFTDLDNEGMLINGFEELGTMATIYNYPYYPAHVERLGYEKEVDWHEFLIEIPEQIPDKHKRIAEIVKKKFNLRVVKFTSRKALKEQYGQALFELINEAYDNLYGYSRLTKRQIDYYIKIYLGMLNLDLVTLIVDGEDQLVGVGISIQSMSRALQKSKGKMFPFGWWHLLKGLKGKNDRVDLLLVAVKPQYMGKGVNALLFTDLIPAYNKYGFKWAESNPELESNAAVQNQWEAFPYRQHRNRRAFIKRL
jgi:GNAT superfamily N-acetyltransferase